MACTHFSRLHNTTATITATSSTKATPMVTMGAMMVASAVDVSLWLASEGPAEGEGASRPPATRLETGEDAEEPE